VLLTQAGYLLGQVIADHPGMKPIVVREVEAFIFRPGLQERARYYAVVFLNQLVLSRHAAHGAATVSSPFATSSHHMLFTREGVDQPRSNLPQTACCHLRDWPLVCTFLAQVFRRMFSKNTAF
jgi:hypothetical protein